jgi:cystathionine beta-lyase/cystathionine gamma-synthase
MRERKLETICAGAGTTTEGAGGNAPLVEPIYASAVFRVAGLEQLGAIYSGQEPGYLYTRDGNPNHAALEKTVAALEGAEAALVCATGMAAVAVALLALVESGGHVVAGAALYGVSTRLIREEWGRLGVSAEFVDATDARAVAAALRPETRLVFVETLSNPLLTLADLPGIAAVCRARGVTLVVDNTFTPCLIRPLEHGADVVMHSVTKYLGGHSDLTLGALAGTRAFIDRARSVASAWGAAANPFEAWLALRGIRTLPLRMERACENAARIAVFLAGHPAVEAVHYPGLPEYAQPALARALLPCGAGAMVTFSLRAGSISAGTFMERLRLIPFAPSLADTTTTLSYPAGTSHRALSEAERAAMGIDDRLIRLSVGIDHVDDVLDDLGQSLGAHG